MKSSMEILSPAAAVGAVVGATTVPVAGAEGSAGAPGSFVASSGPRGAALAGAMGGRAGTSFSLRLPMVSRTVSAMAFSMPTTAAVSVVDSAMATARPSTSECNFEMCGSGFAAGAGGFGTGSAAPAGGGVFFCSSSFIRVMVSLSARGKRGESSPSLVPGWSPRHCRFLRSALRMSPSPSCAQTWAAALGMTG